MKTAVVIAGAGPTGLMLAYELGLAGVPVTLLEQRPEPTGWSQAFAIHTSTNEMFRQRGFDRFQDAPLFTNYNYGFPGVVALDDSHIPRFVPQRQVEAMLTDEVTRIGVKIWRGHRFTGFSQDADGVTVQVETDDGGYEIEAQYLVGCDGGRSLVRKLSEIGFPGTEATVCGRTGDMKILDEEHQNGISTRMLPKGLAAVIRLPDDPGMFRGTVIEFDAERLPAEIPVTAEEFRDAFERVTGIRLNIGHTGWMTRFGDAARHAASYRVGRVFIAGDAAHVHFPSAGQGLNTGMQDAMNLGWKLAAAVRGWAPEGLLDTYHTERHPVGRDACTYPQAQVALLFPPEKAAPLRDLIEQLTKFEDVKRYILERSSGLGITYHMSDDPGDGASNRLLGRRIGNIQLTTVADGEVPVASLLHQGHGVLLLLGADAEGGGLAELAEPWSDRVDVVTAKPNDELDAAALLIRPDGYVAHIDPTGDDAPRLRQALTDWFGRP